MAQLIVRRIEETVVRKLKEAAGLEGISTEEQHRRILRRALLGRPKEKLSLKAHLFRMPDVGDFLDRDRSLDRDVDL